MDSGFPPIDPGTLVAGKLRIVRLLGTGGMGAVYEVEHELTKHRRALKLLHARYKVYPELIQRFLREASAAGRIGNPHIAETFDAGELETGDPYLVMELLKGETLADLLRRKQRLNISEAAELVRQACTGVQAAHDAGIVHRDLKPENLFVVERDHRPFVKILDFGISKFDPHLTGGEMSTTREGASLGTPLYMPPEQVRGDKRVDQRADIYALGVILYECVTGRRPYEAETLAHLAVLIHEGHAEPLAQLRPDAPPAFGEIVHRAMANKPELRFATARELADSLANFTGLVTGPTVGWPGRGARQNAPPPVAPKPPAGPSHGAAVSISQEWQPPRRSLFPFVIAGLAALSADRRGHLRHFAEPAKVRTDRRAFDHDGKRRRCKSAGLGGAAPPPSPRRLRRSRRSARRRRCDRRHVENARFAPQRSVASRHTDIDHVFRKRQGQVPRRPARPRQGQPFQMTRTFRRFLFTAAAVTWVAAPLDAAFAQTPPPKDAKAEARSRFDGGLALFEEGNNAAALAEFQRAYDLIPNPVVLFNIGLVYAAMDRPAEAAASAAKGGEGTCRPFSRHLGARQSDVEPAARSHRGSHRPMQRACDHRSRQCRSGQSSARGPPQNGRRNAHRRRDRRRLHAAAQAAHRGRRREIEPRVQRSPPWKARSRISPSSRSFRPPNVMLDGELVGRTPLTSSLTLMPGNHKVELARSGYRTARTELTLGDGASGEITLEPEEDKAAVGRIGGDLKLVITETEALVTVDGTPRGPYTAALRLAPGTHHLLIERGGFRPLERDVEVAGGQTTVIPIALDPTPEMRELYVGRARSQRTWGLDRHRRRTGHRRRGRGLSLYNAGAKDDARAERDAAVGKLDRMEGVCNRGSIEGNADACNAAIRFDAGQIQQRQRP